MTTSTWRLPSPSPSPPRHLSAGQKPVRTPQLAVQERAHAPSPAGDVSPSPSPPRFRQAEWRPPPAGARRDDEEAEEEEDESPSPPRFRDPSEDHHEPCRAKQPSPIPSPYRATPSPPPRRRARGRREEAGRRKREEGLGQLQDWGEEAVDHPLLDVSFSDGKVHLPRQTKPRSTRSVYSTGAGQRQAPRSKGQRRGFKGQRAVHTSRSEGAEGPAGWPTADVSQVRHLGETCLGGGRAELGGHALFGGPCHMHPPPLFATFTTHNMSHPLIHI